MGLYSLPPHKLTCHLFPIRVFPLWFFMSLYTTELPDQSSWDATRSSELSMAPSEASNDTPASFPCCQSHPQGQVFPTLVPLRHFCALAVNILRWLAPRALLTIFIGPDGSDSPHLQRPPFPRRGFHGSRCHLGNRTGNPEHRFNTQGHKYLLHDLGPNASLDQVLWGWKDVLVSLSCQCDARSWVQKSGVIA